jgi:CMP-N,N'-diacetyllegionaminic acid synthase
MLKVITIIPAREGSKSLPNKNILLLDGKPLLCHSVKYSLNAIEVSRTIVSTDSQEIAGIAKKCGAEVPFLRPLEYAQDDTRDYPFMRHALDYFDSIGEVYDIYILLRPTSPVRPPDLIKKTINIFASNPNTTSIRSVAKIKEHPYRSWSINDDGSMSGLVKNTEEPYNIPRQELPDIYFQTGDIEAVARSTILNGSVSGENIFPLIIEYDDMVDIDNAVDLKKAGEKLRQ